MINLLALASLAAWTMLAATASANPTGPPVVSGQVTTKPATNLPTTIPNWQSFSIGANEITRFVQQSASSAVLNHVTGAVSAKIHGTVYRVVQSNGQLLLLSPSGIVFGPGSQVDITGRVTASLNVSIPDFLGGRLGFAGMARAAANQGVVNAAKAEVYFAGPAVANGAITATPQGEVMLAAGVSVELVDPGAPNLRVEISAPDHEALDLGQIVASSGRMGVFAGLARDRARSADRAVVGAAGEILLKGAAPLLRASLALE